MQDTLVIFKSVQIQLVLHLSCTSIVIYARTPKCRPLDHSLPLFPLFPLFPPPSIAHSQTFENKSSFPPNPPAGLLALVFAVLVLVVAAVVGAALLQPPKSSSPPHPGLFAGTCDVVVAGAAGWLGALDDQASLLPQASMFP